MYTRRTDLAVEARELFFESAAVETELRGVEAEDKTCEGYPVTSVRVLNEEGARSIGKGVGSYTTVTLKGFKEREEDAFSRAARLLRDEIRALLPLSGGDTVLVAALGNVAVTPDALGPLAMENLMVTRHLVRTMPEQFAAFRPVAAIAPGVLGATGMESMDIIRAVCSDVRPQAVIAVDALASRSLERVCRTVQLTDTGITPGSGVGNTRAALDSKTLGVPVLAIGVPTVVDAATLCADVAERSGYHNIDEDALRQHSERMIVTPRDIDSSVRDVAKLIGYGIDLALHGDISIEDITMFLS